MGPGNADCASRAACAFKLFDCCSIFSTSPSILDISGSTPPILVAGHS